MNNKYRLAKKTRKGLQIGVKAYTKVEAEQRMVELKAMGIKMIVVSEDELFS